MIIAESEESKSIRGIILADCSELDKLLSNFLSNYFSKEDKKKELFNLVFNTDMLNLYNKIKIFKRVINTDFYSDYDKLIEALIWLNKTRNHLAHWIWDHEKSQDKDKFSVLKNPSDGKQILLVDNNLLKEHEKRFMDILMFFDVYYA
ncbi:hypothetical protein HYX17_02475 [Candidatus Woesearchaeota archaeon]|nr:hypothetical protein [Candidatus Woesearchaeota archaeon]